MEVLLAAVEALSELIVELFDLEQGLGQFVTFKRVGGSHSSLGKDLTHVPTALRLIVATQIVVLAENARMLDPLDLALLGLDFVEDALDALHEQLVFVDPDLLLRIWTAKSINGVSLILLLLLLLLVLGCGRRPVHAASVVESSSFDSQR